MHSTRIAPASRGSAVHLPQLVHALSMVVDLRRSLHSELLHFALMDPVAELIGRFYLVNQTHRSACLPSKYATSTRKQI